MAPPAVPRSAENTAVVEKKPAPRQSATSRPAKPAPPGGTDPASGDIDAVGGPASKRVLRSQGRRTMRRLLDAAMVAFDQRGYYDTRVNDVVEIAKTSHGTFYLYFSNKEDLLRALVLEAGAEAQHLADALNMPSERGGTPQWEDLRAWISAFSSLWVRYAPLFRAWTDLAKMDPELTDILERTFSVMTDALARQIGPDTSCQIADSKAAGMAVLGMLDGFHGMREFVRQPVDDAALDTLATMIHRALFDSASGRPAVEREVAAGR
jgi:AcrR family transcriptional regulator